jgi:hypothetical protein
MGGRDNQEIAVVGDKGVGEETDLGELFSPAVVLAM